VTIEPVMIGIEQQLIQVEEPNSSDTQASCKLNSVALLYVISDHPAAVTFPLKLVLDLVTPDGRKAELTWMVDSDECVIVRNVSTSHEFCR